MIWGLLFDAPSRSVNFELSP